MLSQLIANLQNYGKLAAEVSLPGLLFSIGIVFQLWSDGIAIPDALWQTKVGTDGRVWTWVDSTYNVSGVLRVDSLPVEPTWRLRDSIRLASLRDSTRGWRGRKDAADAELVVWDSIWAYGAAHIRALSTAYRDDLGQRPVRAVGSLSALRAAHDSLFPIAEERAILLDSATTLATRLEQQNKDLVFFEGDFSRRREATLFSGAMEGLVDTMLAVLALAFVSGLLLRPIGRAWIIDGLFAYYGKPAGPGGGIGGGGPGGGGGGGPGGGAGSAPAGGGPSITARGFMGTITRPEPLLRPVSFYIGKGVITEADHQQFIKDYYSFAGLAAALVLPLFVFAWGASAVGVPFFIILGAVALGLVLIIAAPRQYRVYQDKLAEFIRGKLEKTKEAKTKDGKPSSGTKKPIDVVLVKAMLVGLGTRATSAAKLAKGATVAEIEELKAQSAVLGGKLDGTRIEELDKDLKSFENLIKQAVQTGDETLSELSKKARSLYAEAIRAQLATPLEENPNYKKIKNFLPTDPKPKAP